MNALASFFTRLVNRYMPDPLVIAILLTVLTTGSVYTRHQPIECRTL